MKYFGQCLTNIVSHRGQKCYPDTNDKGQIKVGVIVVSFCQRVIHHPKNEESSFLMNTETQLITRKGMKIARPTLCLRSVLSMYESPFSLYNLLDNMDWQDTHEM